MRSRSSWKFPPRKRCGLQAAEEQIGVGDRGQRAAAVADGAGIGAGGLGAHAHGSGGVEAGERTSSGADGVDVEHGHPDRETGDFGLTAGLGFAVDECDVGGSASHVEGDDLVEAAEACGGRGSDYTTGRAGEHGTDGLAGCCGKCGDAAAGLHDENPI